MLKGFLRVAAKSGFEREKIVGNNREWRRPERGQER
jgi:hypothetical protein